MSDFIREVDEEYRRDRLIKTLSRFQIPIAILVVAIVVGAGVWRYWVDHGTASAEKDNSRYLEAELLGKQGKLKESAAAFEAITKSGRAGYAMLARMRAIEVGASADPDRATTAFDAVANDEALPASIRETARLRGAMLQVDREDWKTFEQRYGRFSVQAYGFRNSMRELLALSALKAGDQAAAGKYLDQIFIDPGAPGALRNRAEAFRALVTGGAATASDTPVGPASVTPLTPAQPPSVPAPSKPSPPTAEAPAPKP